MQPGRGKKRKKRVEEKEESRCPYVPEEIVVLILPKLPVKSLLRFKCVSKSWFSLILDPKFKLTPRQQVIAMSSRGPTRSVNKWRFSIHLIDNEASVTELPIPNQLIDGSSKGRARLRGSCNGLLLVSSGEELFLWNPLTGCCNKVLSHFWLAGGYNELLVSGLCYDSFTDDYKMVMAFTSGDYFMVGSFRNETWTKIRFPYNKENLKSGPTVNNRVHSLVGSREDQGSHVKPYFIVSFDPQTNEFVKLPMPEHERFKGSVVRGFGVLDGCLSLAWSTNCHGRCKVSEVEVLAMTTYGDKASWTSLFIISDLVLFDRLYTLVELLGSTKNGEVLTHLYSTSRWEVPRQWKADWRILAYNTKRNMYRDFPIPNHRGQIYCSTVFVESLVSPQIETIRRLKHTQGGVIVLE